MGHIFLPLQEPELYRKYRIDLPNGVLLYGPQGCGKTFIARVLAQRPGYSFTEVKRKIQVAIDRARAKEPQLDGTLKTNRVYTAFLFDPNHPWPIKVQEVVNVVAGEEINICGSQGSTDVAYTVKKTGLVSASFGVGRAKESHGHGVDENARVSDTLNLVKVVCALVTQAI